MTDTKQYFNLVAGQILFMADGESGPGIVTLNCLVKSPNKGIILHDIGSAQKGLQINFMKKIGADTKVEVRDVVILSITELGWFTEKEFNRVPDMVVPKSLADA
jgi:hypothetical protein